MKKITTVLCILLLTLISHRQNFGQSITYEQKINENLEKIENMYISKLSYSERRKAINLLDETIDLINIVSNKKDFHIVSDTAFQALLSQIKGTIDESKKNKLIMSIGYDGKILTSQLKAILETYSFDRYKAECIKQIYHNMYDKENISIVIKLIDSDFTKDELIDFIKTFKD